MTSPAERLLKAAGILDKRASEATAGPWQVDGPWWWTAEHATSMVTAGTRRDAVAIAPPEVPDADLRYIAMMGPDKGREIAQWLRETGEDVAAFGVSAPGRFAFHLRYALALADLVLAGEQEQVER